MHAMELEHDDVTTFRASFRYNNVMYLLAGCVAELVGRAESLDRLMADRHAPATSCNSPAKLSTRIPDMELGLIV